MSRNLFLLGELKIYWMDSLSTDACSPGHPVKAGINMIGNNGKRGKLKVAQGVLKDLFDSEETFKTQVFKDRDDVYEARSFEQVQVSLG